MRARPRARVRVSVGVPVHVHVHVCGCMSVWMWVCVCVCGWGLWVRGFFFVHPFWFEAVSLIFWRIPLWGITLTRTSRFL